MTPTPRAAPPRASIVPVAPVHRALSNRAVTSRSTAPRVFHVVLGRWAFCACWWLVVGLHAFLGAFTLSAAALHWYLQTEMVAMAVSALNVPADTLEMTARVFFAVGLVHCVVIVRVLYHSFHARQLILHASKVAKKSRTGDGLAGRTFQLYNAVSVAWGRLFSPTGFFGFSNPHFEMLFLFREGWEILLQTYQAYKLSESVPRKWINQLAVAVIVLNCAGSPLVHLLFRRQEGRRRVLNLLQDAVLDFCCSIVIPLSIILPYTGSFNPRTNTFPDKLLMDDRWFVNAVAETRQVLVTSFPDFVSTMIPQISLLGYLMTFKNLLRRRSAGVHDRQETQVEKLPSVEKQQSTRARGPVFTATADTVSRPPEGSRRLNSERMHRWVSFVTHVLFIVWGCGVLGLHLDAYRYEDVHVPGCQLHVSAWHSARYPCSVIQLNCHENQIEGSDDDLTPIFGMLERSSLRIAVFTHCPHLVVPPIITEFDQLVGIELFNSTLVDWPEQAAIREATQPHIGYIYFVLTNWTSFPAGLLHDQLPAQFTHLFVVANNVTELPEAVGNWSSHEWIAIIFERVPLLTTIPDSFCSLETSALWFAGSGLTSLPRECMMHDSLVELGISGSALRSLPDVVGRNLLLLNAEDAKLAELPDWFDDWYQSAPPKIAAFHGSAVCDTPTLHQGMPLWDKTCRDEQPFAKAAYPMDLMISLRPFDSPQDYKSLVS